MTDDRSRRTQPDDRRRLRKMPISENDFEEVVGKLVERAEHLLSREATVGRRSNFLGTEKPNEEEFFDRLLDIRRSLNALLAEHQKLTQNGILRTDIPADDRINAFLSLKLSSLDLPSQKEELTNLWEGMDSYLKGLHRDHAELLRRASGDNDIAELLTPEELEPDDPVPDANGDPEPPTTIMSADDAREAASLTRHIDVAMRSQAEIRSLIAGRFDAVAKRQGRIERRRGRAFASHLIGYAEGRPSSPTRRRSCA